MKNIIVNGIAGAAFVLLLLSAACGDSENIILPIMMMLGSVGVLGLMAAADGAWNI